MPTALVIAIVLIVLIQFGLFVLFGRRFLVSLDRRSESELNARTGKSTERFADESTRTELIAEGRAAGLAEGQSAGYAQGRRAGRNEAKAAALVEARLAARRQVSDEITTHTRDEIRAGLIDEVRNQVQDELDGQLRIQRAETLREAQHARTEAKRLRNENQAHIDSARRQAEVDIEEMLLAARRDAEREAERLVERSKDIVADAERRELRVSDREARSDAEVRRLTSREVEVSAAEELQSKRVTSIDQREESIIGRLEQVAGLSAQEAKAALLAEHEVQSRRDAASQARRIEAEAVAGAQSRARAIVADSIARVASEQTAESVVAVMHLPSDDMKGRIIGREGRNIRAFETTTGVNLIIDDTPEAVLLSCFDPVRREIGRLTLTKLVADGRIHPHRIEEAYEQSKSEVDALCIRAAEDALIEVGIADVHPELIALLGRLRYRTSYGQNVLLHLVETAHIASAMAHELGVPAQLVKRSAFLHDIGKAVTHEIEGSHAIIGADLARRYGESEEVVHAIEAHHNEVMPQTIEAVLTQASDACSGGRPGARRESVEAYVQRLQRIEQIAASKVGVEKVFAMQAGREVRVMVKPEVVDDVMSAQLAREVATQIEDELTYPGQIRVTVIRESRASEVAH
ncbi:MAG: ribonuclease Y [Antricoccus sp.]